MKQEREVFGCGCEKETRARESKRQYCIERFGDFGKKKEATPSAKSIREKGILELVKEWRALHKAWKNAEEYLNGG